MKADRTNSTAQHREEAPSKEVGRAKWTPALRGAEGAGGHREGKQTDIPTEEPTNRRMDLSSSNPNRRICLSHERLNFMSFYDESGLKYGNQRVDGLSSDVGKQGPTLKRQNDPQSMDMQLRPSLGNTSGQQEGA